MKHLIILFIVSLLIASCNDRGIERLKQYQEQYHFVSPVCANGVCIE